MLEFLSHPLTLEYLTWYQVGTLLAIALLGTFFRPTTDPWQHRLTQACVWLLALATFVAAAWQPLAERETWQNVILRFGFLTAYNCWLVARIRAVLPAVGAWWAARGV